MLMHYFYSERMVDDGDVSAAEQVKRRAEMRVSAMLDRLDEQLDSHGGPWLLGSTFSAVDPYALMLCRWTRNFARPARSLPRLAPYLQRMLARPAIRMPLRQSNTAAAAVRVTRPTRGGMQRTRAPRSP